MVDLQILELFGSTKARLKELFTAEASNDDKPQRGESAQERTERIKRYNQNLKDTQQRALFQRKLESRNNEGIMFSIKEWRKFAAVDMAWDSSVITKTTLPLLLYAQGKIDVQRAAKSLESCTNGEQFIKRDPTTKVPQSIDIARFAETEFNIVRSVILRRWAAQKNIFGKLWPHYVYEPRSTDYTAKCRADVLSQRVDIMSDQFNYRHHDEQVMLDGFLYGHSVVFPRCAWEIEKQYRIKNFKAQIAKENVEAIITKEGLSFYNPHPSRVFWDNTEALNSLNTDTGPRWLGYWDVVRYSEIEDNPFYFNTDKVTWPSPSGQGRFFVGNPDFLDFANQYNFTVSSPLAIPTTSDQPAAENDRKGNVSRYNSTQRDVSVFKTEYFEKVIPRDMGVGEYPFEVWLRLVVASDNTVIYAEFLPSLPGAVLSINESDGRQLNVSMAMELLQYQQQMTNLLTHLVSCLKIEGFKAIGINQDALDPDDAKKLVEALRGDHWYEDPIVYKYSFSKLVESMGGDNIKAAAAVERIILISEARNSQAINTIFDSMIKLISMIERLFAMSPAEQGQPAPREISATESTFINSTTSSIYSSISSSINEYRSAKKQIIYESLVSCGQAQIECPVKYRYSRKTVEAAGFTVVGDANVDVSALEQPKEYTVTGSPRSLVFNYVFTTRDGDDRATNTQAANTLVQLLNVFLASPMAQEPGAKSKVYMIMNDLFRQSGSGIDLNMELQEGEEDSLGPDQAAQMQQSVQQLVKMTQQLAQQVQDNAQKIQAQEQVNEEQQQAIDSYAKLAEQVRDIAESQQEMLQERNGKPPELRYGDAPVEVQAQIEAMHGIAPVSKRTYPQKTAAKK